MVSAELRNFVGYLLEKGKQKNWGEIGDMVVMARGRCKSGE